MAVPANGTATEVLVAYLAQGVVLLGSLATNFPDSCRFGGAQCLACAQMESAGPILPLFANTYLFNTDTWTLVAIQVAQLGKSQAAAR